MACRVIGRRSARSVAVAGPPEASAARMPRRLGSARAMKTCSAIASMSAGIEVFDQLAQLARPTLGVAVVGLAVGVVRQLGELDGPLDAIGESHDSLQRVATI